MSADSSFFRRTFILFLSLFSVYTSFGQVIPSAFFEEETTDSEKIECLKRMELGLFSESDSLHTLLDEGVVLAAENNEVMLENTLKLIQIQYSRKIPDEKIESLNRIQDIAQKQDWDSLHIAAEYLICRSLEDNGRMDEAQSKLLALLESDRFNIDDYPQMHGLFLEEIGILYQEKSDFKNALEMYQKSLAVNTKSNDKRRLVTSYINLGNIYLSLGERDSSKYYTEGAIRIAKEINKPFLEAHGYLNMAMFFGYNGSFDSCLVYGLLLEELSAKHGYSQYSLHSNDMIAACYVSLKNPKRALPYQLKAYELGNGDKEKSKLALNVGLCYIDLNEYDNAEKYYLKALANARSLNSNWEITNVLNHLGFLYLDQGDIGKAKTYCMQSEKALLKISDPFLIGETQRCLAQYYHKTNRNQKSNDFANGAISNITSFENLAKVYKLKALNHDALSEYDSASAAYKLYIVNQDSFQRQTDKELEQTILAKYSVEKAENQVKIAAMDKEVSDLNAEKQRRMKLFGFLLLGLSLLSIVIIVSRHKRFLAERDKTMQLEKEVAQGILDNSRSVLASQSELILNKNRLIDELKSNLTTLFNDVSVDTTGMNNFLDSKILTKEDWKKFKISFTVVYPTFIKRAGELYPNLTASELRLLCLQKLGMNTQESADMLGVLHDSVKRTTLRIFQKFNIDSSLSLLEVVEAIQ